MGLYPQWQNPTRGLFFQFQTKSSDSNANFPQQWYRSKYHNTTRIPKFSGMEMQLIVQSTKLTYPNQLNPWQILPPFPSRHLFPFAGCPGSWCLHVVRSHWNRHTKWPSPFHLQHAQQQRRHPNSKCSKLLILINLSRFRNLNSWIRRIQCFLNTTPCQIFHPLANSSMPFGPATINGTPRGTPQT